MRLTGLRKAVLEPISVKAEAPEIYRVVPVLECGGRDKEKDKEKDKDEGRTKEDNEANNNNAKGNIDPAIKMVGNKSQCHPKESVPYLQLMSFADGRDCVFIVVALVAATLASLRFPLEALLYGEYTALLLDRTVQGGTSTTTAVLKIFGGGRVLTNATHEENMETIREDAKAFALGCLVVAACQFIVGVISIDLMNYSALRQISRIRRKLLKSILRQDIAWFDTNTTMNFASKVSDDLNKMRLGMGEKVSVFVYLMMSFVTSAGLAFIYGWKLTVVVLAACPLVIGSTAIVIKLQSSLTVKELNSYGKAGIVAEEVLSAMRTVHAFSGEDKEIARYKDRLQLAKKTGSWKGLYSGIGNGVMWFMMYSINALGFWYGVELILGDRGKTNPEYTPAVLMIIFLGIFVGAQNMGLTSPHLEAFSSARASAVSLFEVMRRKPTIDSLSNTGQVPLQMAGHVEFSNIRFTYPTRPDVRVLRGITLKVAVGETVALVGPSGCGKSTLIQLVQRLYDPDVGLVSVDGYDLRTFNVRSLRSLIGVVGQEPVLFAGTIRENIRYGRPSCSEREIINAAITANCNTFITELPDGYDTIIGDSGSQLSGGQKQRIAIARALVRNPTILLLDEATSALDSQSEAKVQAALDSARQGRTTIMISHRLSTLTNADRIVYMNRGVVEEMGTHAHLMALKGKYYQLVMLDQAAMRNNMDKLSKPDIIDIKSQISIKPSKSSISLASFTRTPVPAASETDEKQKCAALLKRIMRLNMPEMPYIVVGSMCSLAAGAALPVLAILFGEVYGILQSQDKDYVRTNAMWIAMGFVITGLVCGTAVFLQVLLLNIAGTRLTSRLRIQTFSTMLNQDVAWFDDRKNSVGALASRLAADCGAVQGATGTCIGTVLQAISTMTIGAAVSLYYSWRMALVSMLTVPLVLAAVILEERLMAAMDHKEREAMEEANRIATEAISNIRTVASLSLEKNILKRYCAAEGMGAAQARKRMRTRGLVFSAGQTAPLLGYALALYYGGILVATDRIKFADVIIVSEALVFAAWMLGQSMAFAPDFGAGLEAARRIFKLLDTQPSIQTEPSSLEMQNFVAKGDILYDDIYFSYPTRPSVQVLRGLQLEVRGGQTVALVGSSGCGKSTVIQLIQRFYDPDRGEVYLDGHNIKTQLPLHRLRAQLGIVSQEPVLFDKSIAENIAYGDNQREVGLDEVIRAAKAANIHPFIISLPLAYKTILGPRGAQLSGGQKQRIAIARALIANPRVLLLDEATSALDSQSEKIVQDALDKASKDRTCIIIAHRLATVNRADLICVIERGIIVEMGTHTELLELNGHYAQLYSLQAAYQNN